VILAPWVGVLEARAKNSRAWALASSQLRMLTPSPSKRRRPCRAVPGAACPFRCHAIWPTMSRSRPGGGGSRGDGLWRRCVPNRARFGVSVSIGLPSYRGGEWVLSWVDPPIGSLQTTAKHIVSGQVEEGMWENSANRPFLCIHHLSPNCRLCKPLAITAARRPGPSVVQQGGSCGQIEFEPSKRCGCAGPPPVSTGELHRLRRQRTTFPRSRRFQRATERAPHSSSLSRRARLPSPKRPRPRRAIGYMPHRLPPQHLEATPAERQF
jgi:hypothetical protein